MDLVFDLDLDVDLDPKAFKVCTSLRAF